MNDWLEQSSAFSGWIGVAREEITPPSGIYARNWGAAVHDAAEGIHRPLTLTAIAFRRAREEPPLVLFTADLGWWRRREDEWALRGAVLDALSIDPSRLMIALAHTHSGPSICPADADQPGGERIGPYLDQLRAAAIRAGCRAVGEARPATLEWEQGVCDLARNRDLLDPAEPRIACGYNPNGPEDATLLVGRVTGRDGSPVATLVNYACHPISLAWENRLLSPDYPGAMRELVERETGAPCLFLLGAAGELGAREQYSGDPAAADRNGRKLGWAVLSTLEGMLPPETRLRYEGVIESGAPLAIWKREKSQASGVLEAMVTAVDLPLKALPTVEEIDRRMDACGDRAMRERLARLRRVVVDVGAGSTAAMPVWAWRIGDAIFVGHPNEAYSAYQIELRRRFPERSVVVMNVVNGHHGYLPSASLYDMDAYPVWQTPFERGSLEILVERSATSIERLLSDSDR